ncbi:MAG: hypothetical protein H0X26_01320 [Alphaproteobacteria bacterium]|nr:hypothetical protein [Alphaproteobacteria bacterium]
MKNSVKSLLVCTIIASSFPSHSEAGFLFSKPAVDETPEQGGKQRRIQPKMRTPWENYSYPTHSTWTYLSYPVNLVYGMCYSIMSFFTWKTPIEGNIKAAHNSASHEKKDERTGDSSIINKSNVTKINSIPIENNDSGSQSNSHKTENKSRNIVSLTSKRDEKYQNKSNASLKEDESIPNVSVNFEEYARNIEKPINELRAKSVVDNENFPKFGSEETVNSPSLLTLNLNNHEQNFNTHISNGTSSDPQRTTRRDALKEESESQIIIEPQIIIFGSLSIEYPSDLKLVPNSEGGYTFEIPKTCFVQIFPNYEASSKNGHVRELGKKIVIEDQEKLKKSMELILEDMQEKARQEEARQEEARQGRGDIQEIGGALQKTASLIKFIQKLIGEQELSLLAVRNEKSKISKLVLKFNKQNEGKNPEILITVPKQKEPMGTKEQKK